MTRIEYPVWTVTRSILAMPFRYPLALLKFGLLPLLIATVCLPPPVNLATNTEVTINGDPAGTPISEKQSLTDGELGWRDLIGFLLMLPFAAAFAAAWSRLTATGEESQMGRPPIAFDSRTIGVTWAFLRLTFVALGIVVLLFLLALAVFGSYHDGTFSFSYNVSVDEDGLWPTLLAMGATLLGFTILAWFMLRLTMVIPASAMGNPISLRESWRRSAPVHMRLLGVATLLTVAYIVLNFLLMFLMVPLMPIIGLQGTFYAMVPLYFVLLVYGHAIWVGLLGATYGLLEQQQRRPEVSGVFD